MQFRMIVKHQGKTLVDLKGTADLTESVDVTAKDIYVLIAVRGWLEKMFGYQFHFETFETRAPDSQIKSAEKNITDLIHGESRTTDMQERLGVSGKEDT